MTKIISQASGAGVRAVPHHRVRQREPVLALQRRRRRRKLCQRWFRRSFRWGCSCPEILVARLSLSLPPKFLISCLIPILLILNKTESQSVLHFPPLQGAAVLNSSGGCFRPGGQGLDPICLSFNFIRIERWEIICDALGFFSAAVMKSKLSTRWSLLRLNDRFITWSRVRFLQSFFLL